MARPDAMKRWLFLPSSVHKDIEALGRLRAEEVEKLKKILDSEAGKSRYAIYLQIVEELGVPDQDAARLHSFWEYARDEQTKHDKPAADVINEFVKALTSS